MTEPAAPREEPNCVDCGSPLSPQAKRCTECNAWVGKRKTCTICGAQMLDAGIRCGTCLMYPGWRRFLNIPATVGSTLTALLAVATLAMNTYPAWSNRKSNTSLTSVTADGNVLYVPVFNTGRAPSTLRRFELRFSDGFLQDEPVELIPEHKKAGLSLVQGGTQNRIGLLVKGLQSKCHGIPPIRYTHEEVVDWLRGHPVTLAYEVEESQRKPGWKDTEFSGDVLLNVVNDADKLITDEKCK